MTSEADNIVPLPSAEVIEEEAANWFAALDREDIAPEELSAFKRWMAASERHRAAFEQLSGLWGALEALSALDGIAERDAPVQQRAVFSRRAVAAIAVSFAALVIAGAAFYTYHLGTLSQSGAYVTAVGEQRTVELADGSTVQLNTNSRVEVDYTRRDRDVRLVRGEAHFDVVKNLRRPFSVHAADGVVRAVGTAFTVRLREASEIEVTVEEGRVSLLNIPRKRAAPGQKPVERAPLAQLTAGQSARFDVRVEEVEQMLESELKRKLAWRQGMLAYSGEPLAEVVADVGRYTDMTIEIADPALGAKPVAGYFRVGEMEGLFDSLELNFGVTVERVNKKHVRLTQAS